MSEEETDHCESEVVCDDVEWFPADRGDLKFSLIGAMSSSLLAVDTQGKLHQWFWDDVDDFQQVNWSYFPENLVSSA